jgi:AraC family transcriptional regulator of adaptative response/methylated-DNA-[protein]-cysteine methyltransferase
MNAMTTQREQLTVPSGDQMYAAVAERDASCDGQFYYGVITTGVFCKPSCAARLAKRENMRFFTDASSASRAGFRPCKRCRPDNLQRDLERLVSIARFIEAHADERLTLADLSTKAKLAPSRLQKAFKALFFRRGSARPVASTARRRATWA